MATSKLTELVGSETMLELLNPVVRPKKKADKTQGVKLIAVESAGIWVESPQITDILLEPTAAVPRTPILFFPFSPVRYVFIMRDLVALSEKSWRLGIGFKRNFGRYGRSISAIYLSALCQLILLICCFHGTLKMNSPLWTQVLKLL